MGTNVVHLLVPIDTNERSGALALVERIRSGGTERPRSDTGLKPPLSRMVLKHWKKVSKMYI